jgi:hypothetical protein
MRPLAVFAFLFTLLPSTARAQDLTCWAFPSDPDVIMVCDKTPVVRPKVVSFGEASVGLASTGQDAQAWLRLTNSADLDQPGITYTIYPEGLPPVTRTITLYTPNHGRATIGIPLHDDPALAGQHLAFAVEVVFPRGRGIAGLTVRDAAGHALAIPSENSR